MRRYAPLNNQTKMIYGTNPAGVNTVLLYVMFAAPNAATSEAAWQIQYMTYDASDNLLMLAFPQNSDGNASADFGFIANNYASYTYGPA